MYPIDLVITYESDEEYKRVIAQLFACNINSSVKFEINEDVDIDMDVDDNYFKEFLDYVYERTCHHEDFIKIYTLGAAMLITEDLSIGLAVLFSYDYLIMFHTCLCYFFNAEDISTNKQLNTYPTYISLMAKLQEK